MDNTSSTKPKQATNKKYMLIRFGRMNDIGFFEHKETNIPIIPKRAVIQTNRGLELGYLVGQLCPNRSGQFKLSMQQVKDYFQTSQIDFPKKPIGRLIRFATADDISEERHLEKIAREEIQYCKKLVKEADLPMKIIDADHIFGGERVIFYFMAESRVDFRDLVKKLAHEYQTRIEMRQIGSRDEAKLLGDVESCGQQCCCKRFLKALKPVNMRMAKVQKATLDPAKISGYCGRLKCCLRYEDENYTALKKKLPKRGKEVKTEHGQGRVINTQILTQLVVVEHQDGKRISFPLEEIEILDTPQTQRRPQAKNSDSRKADNSNKDSDNNKPGNNGRNSNNRKPNGNNKNSNNRRPNNNNRNSNNRKPDSNSNTPDNKKPDNNSEALDNKKPDDNNNDT